MENTFSINNRDNRATTSPRNSTSGRQGSSSIGMRARSSTDRPQALPIVPPIATRESAGVEYTFKFFTGAELAKVAVTSRENRQLANEEVKKFMIQVEIRLPNPKIL